MVHCHMEDHHLDSAYVSTSVLNADLKSLGILLKSTAGTEEEG